MASASRCVVRRDRDTDGTAGHLVLIVSSNGSGVSFNCAAASGKSYLSA